MITVDIRSTETDKRAEDTSRLEHTQADRPRAHRRRVPEAHQTLILEDKHMGPRTPFVPEDPRSLATRPVVRLHRELPYHREVKSHELTLMAEMTARRFPGDTDMLSMLGLDGVTVRPERVDPDWRP